MLKKDRTTAGADEQTPSRAQYFSWINNTNEGATEAQTLINLAYFAWLRDEYGMQLDIYALDAGNLDGAAGTYEGSGSEKLLKQYPQGYKNIGAAAKEMDTKLGVWCGPDGFGSTAESERARYELMVSLCRDHNFGLFKMDAVCGELRRDKQNIFIKMLQECRQYAPDLILLNHRLRLGKAAPYATTFLWGGAETYTDIHICNENTALHHRAYTFTRGNVPGLKRLTEDHGVCLSSCLDYFEDELIFQAFGRCLILAPEIYANPWFLRDEEQAHLARIYRLHRRYRDILVSGKLLRKEEYGANAVSRGDGSRRLLTMGNNSWVAKTVHISLDTSLGLAPCERVFVAARHPYEQVYGEFAFGDIVEVSIAPFRACLLEVCDAAVKPPMLTDCAYEVLHEKEDGTPEDIRLYAANEASAEPDGKKLRMGTFDFRMRAPKKIATTHPVPLTDARRKLETALFAADTDSLEARCLRRAGKTKYPAVQACRDAFFNQKTYILRGPENRFAFDNDPNTYFDGMSKLAFDGMRIKGGCLRVDFGKVYAADTVVIEYFLPDKPDNETFSPQHIAQTGETSENLADWQVTGPVEKRTVCAHETMEGIVVRVHNIKEYTGARMEARYPVQGSCRYFTLDCPPDRIYKLALLQNGEELPPENPIANNLFAPYIKTTPKTEQCAAFTLREEDWREGCQLALAIEGTHGDEGAYALLSCGDAYIGASDRAVSYRANAFECPVRGADSGYTYFFPVQKEWLGKELTVHVLGTDARRRNFSADLWLCDGKTAENSVYYKV